MDAHSHLDGPTGPADPDGAKARRFSALDAMVEAHYPTLREVALKIVRQHQGQGMVDPTELVHESYMRLARNGTEPPVRRTAFLALAATVIRSSFVDLARELATLKRGGHLKRITLDGRGLATGNQVDILALDEALDKLARLDARQARVVELKFFAGLSIQEIAELLEVSPRTIDNEWTLARAWLHRELGPDDPRGPGGVAGGPDNA